MDEAGEVPLDSLKALIKFHEEVMAVATGDDYSDEQYRHGAESVLNDLKKLCGMLPQDEEEDADANSDRPIIPPGFKLYLVRH